MLVCNLLLSDSKRKRDNKQRKKTGKGEDRKVEGREDGEKVENINKENVTNKNCNKVTIHSSSA